MSSRNIVFEDAESENFRYVYATGVFGSLDPNDGKMIFYLDRLTPQTDRRNPAKIDLGKVTRELQVEVRVPLGQFKRIAQWMNTLIERYEKQYGEIPVSPTGRQSDAPSGIIA